MTEPVFVFDKDGVLVDSEPIKLAALEELFLPHGEAVFAKVRAFNRANVGMPRREKLEHFFGQILPCEDREAKVEKYLDLSYHSMRDRLMRAPATPGVLDFIRSTPNPKYVCSVALRDEVIDQLRALDIEDAFADVHAYPEEKSEVLARLRTVSERPVIFWGDTLRDLEAARAAGVGFIGVGQEGFVGQDVPTIADFGDRDRLARAMASALGR